MSIVGYFFGGSKQKKGKKLTAAARREQGSAADQLFQEAYSNFAEVAHSHSTYPDALHNWGFALFHQAQTKSGDEAIKLYEEAMTKFSSCLTVATDHLGGAVDGGVAILGLAKAKKVKLDDELYTKAKELFIKAEQIQEGAASYNLACIYALQKDGDACLKELEKARDLGLIPDVKEILNDEDLGNIKDLPWFDQFIQSLSEDDDEGIKEDESVEKEAKVESKKTPVKKSPAKKKTTKEDEKPAE